MDFKELAEVLEFNLGLNLQFIEDTKVISGKFENHGIIIEEVPGNISVCVYGPKVNTHYFCKKTEEEVFYCLFSQLKKINLMIIHNVIRKGSDHKVFCEDFIFHQENNRYIVAAILDGCSTGTDSHFASALFGKSLRTSFNLWGRGDGFSKSENVIREIVYTALVQVNTVRTIFQLGIKELLATVIFSLYDKHTRELNLIVIGDGVFVVNREATSIDQNNTPDYISYHIETLIQRDKFDEWFETFPNKFRFENVNDYSICSDGIESFKTVKATPDGEKDPVEFFTKDIFLINNPSMLGRKCNILEMKHGMTHTDDLSVIRVYSEPEIVTPKPEETVTITE